MKKFISSFPIGTSIPEDSFISDIRGLIGNVEDVTLEVKIDDMRTFENNTYMFVLLELSDEDGNKIKGLMSGPRRNNIKELVRELYRDAICRVRGDVTLMDEESSSELPFEVDSDRVLFITAIQNVDSLFGVNISILYDYKLNKAYNLVKTNTNYLDSISIDEVEDIKFSCYKDVIILLKNGLVLVNGRKRLDNIKKLEYKSGLTIFAFSNDNVITPVIGRRESTLYINNNNYKYKKIIITPLMIVALTFEGDVRVYLSFLESAIDHSRFVDVEDIGYVEKNDDIVVIKDGKVYSLFLQADYSDYVPEVMVVGDSDNVHIIEY